MDVANDSNKHKGKGFSLMKQFFEIKRPLRGQSATLPRTKTAPIDDDDNVSKDRLFVRHHSYRRSTKKNKYKKETSQKNPNEKFSVEPENNVKRICQQFETLVTNEQENISRIPETSTQKPYSILQKEDEAISDAIREVLAKKEAEITFLKSLHKNTEFNKRFHKKNSKEMRDRKIKSFVEAGNEEETEEYRKSLITEMDKELAQMKEDGFLDDNENISTAENHHDDVFESDKLYHQDNTFLTHIQRRRGFIDSNVFSFEFIANEDEEEQGEINISPYEELHDTFLAQMHRNGASYHEINTTNTVKEKFTNYVENESSSVTELNMDVLNERFRDEFSESLGEDLENGLYILEAYNDEGRELIEVQVMIDRRNVNIDTRKSIQEAIKHSNMTFFQHEDNTFDVVQDVNEIKQKCETEQKSETENASASNRSTIYSVTSQESSIEDDDEGIEIGRVKVRGEVYHNVRRETFCDDKGIVRIERVAFSDNFLFPTENISSPVSRSNSDATSKKLNFIIDEIKTTERKYVEDLTKVVKVYKPYIESHTPPNLKAYQGYLFGNIEKILRRQRKFLEDLEISSDFMDVIQCFIDHELLFEQYPRYFRNKPKADSWLKEFLPIIREMQEKFGERLDFSAYLLTPVQRLGKYILFLEKIEKQLEKMNLPIESAQIALAIVREEMSKGNDSVAIESIENCLISKTDYGSFKMREKFNIIKPRKVESAVVFLFTNVVVFTIADPKNLETFNYYDHIKMNDLRIASFDDYTIHLTDFTKSKKKQNAHRYTYVLETKTEKSWRTWKEAIEKILWDQLVQVKETFLNMSPENQRKYKINKSRTKSVGSSKFYCE